MNFKYNLQLSVSAILFLLPAFVVNGFTADTYVELNPNRIAEIESLLPEQPAGFGRPASDQEFWTRAQTRTIAGDSVAATEKLLGQSFPAWNDDLYLDFSRTDIAIRFCSWVRLVTVVSQLWDARNWRRFLWR
jgi:hypothetical protein